ncbi:hypothetical protein DZC72_14165 [Maribacter algicola]|uniref:Uncharacterized protein n=1 Tax=Maribacter algicola TaxID=2498892 RepID=A0A426RIN5_9FLAO|nr:hypothetical protein DZC72_14165 [Maribacter algicola]
MPKGKCLWAAAFAIKQRYFKCLFIGNKLINSKTGLQVTLFSHSIRVDLVFWAKMETELLTISGNNTHNNIDMEGKRLC